MNFHSTICLGFSWCLIGGGLLVMQVAGRDGLDEKSVNVASAWGIFLFALAAIFLLEACRTLFDSNSTPRTPIARQKRHISRKIMLYPPNDAKSND